MDPRQTAETFNSIEPLLFWLVAGLIAVCAIATVVTQNIVRSATWLLFTLAGTSAIFFLLGADLVGATQLLVYVGGTLVLVVFGVMLTAQGPFISMKASGAEWAISLVAGMLLLVVLTTGIITEASLGPDNPARKPAEPVNKYARAFSRSQAQAVAGKPEQPNVVVPPAGMADGNKGMGPPGGDGKKGKGPPGGGGKKDKGAGDADGKKGKSPGGGDGKKGKGPAAITDAPPEGAQLKSEVKDPVPALDPATSPQSAVLGESFLGVGNGPAHVDGRKMSIIRTSYLLPFEIVSVHLLVVLIGAAYLARAKRRRGGEG
jgi:NADH:ubiquinone oxidoreductase subunit 6 (subunit J)